MQHFKTSAGMPSFPGALLVGRGVRGLAKIIEGRFFIKLYQHWQTPDGVQGIFSDYVLPGIQLRVVLYLALHLLCPVLDYLPCGRLKGGNFLLCWAQGLLDFTIHPLDVARVCCQLTLGAELKPVVIGATLGILLDFAPGHPEDLQLAFAGAGFVRLPRRSASSL